ncbi:BREX-1 system phosphatase PglZ type A [Roseimaritima ulvae]|uniref:PglZ domain protein n=1 Tax=Roseimaritima ulvae TaxID=980254 RepID=A0A5B9QZM9_9BACT|nr:BREX-1 system phosphatase PglZ type A [Roseimaritima ulvae]QEG43429.1 PglZ domain protein [Roseimaritima ulvae]
MTDRINQALGKLFAKHRIVFWYDEEDSLRKDYESVDVAGVEKVEIANNEFGLKYRMLRQQPKQKFLVFKTGGPPEDKENWLLDVQLAHTDFRTDKASLWLTELELPYEFRPLVSRHEFFFNSAKRRDSLKKKVTKNDTLTQVAMKMLGVCADCADNEPRLDSVIENLLAELAKGDGAKRYDLILKCGLDGFLWEQTKNVYQYAADSPTVKDFAIELFKSCYRMDVGGEVRLGSEALVFLKRWKDSRTHEAAFETLSHQCAEMLGIVGDLENRDMKALFELDYFELVDQRILSELASAVAKKTISSGECTQLVRGRRRGHWYAKYEHYYEAVEHAAELLHLLDTLSIQLESLQQGVTAYIQTFYKLDQVYRKFIFHTVKSGGATLLGTLTDEICKRYTNAFLMPLGDRWQELVDGLDKWAIPDSRPQTGFFDKYVRRVLEKNKKVYVIISDAMRFEVGEELCRRVRQEDKFEADLDHMITTLPSYTQLGMAALLPHKTLRIQNDKTPTVAADAVSTSGTTNRNKILSNGARQISQDASAIAVLAREIKDKNTEYFRTLVRDHDVVYIYHDTIDNTGHTQKTEREAFDAAERAINDVIALVRKLTSGTATNVVVTADHGFLYQDEVEESDFSSAEVAGDISASDRRFMVGRNLQVTGGANLYSSSSLGLDGDLQVAVPKSINRFRKSGSSTRFMHGGSTLQEIVIPVISIKKSRGSDVTAVGVDMIPPPSIVISTGQLAVVFYQSEPVTEKVQARRLRVGLYAPDGELISDSHVLAFDLTSENARERELKVRLLLSKQADNYNQQQIMLKMEEPISDTSQYKEYKSVPFTLRRSFTSDFD